MNGRVFVDTNVLIYAHDLDAGPKREIASEILTDLWESRRGVLSVQVLEEFYVNVTRKIPSPLQPAAARAVVQTYTAWPVEPLTPPMVLQASEIEERHGLSFWDALIVTAAVASGAETILSEDLRPGAQIEGVSIEDPFASLPR